MQNIEFTLREFIIGSILGIVMFGIGFYLATIVHDKITERNEEYFKAVKVTSPEVFDYGISTNVGNILAEGTFKAVDTVKHKNIKGEYLYIEEIEEHYVQKTRTVSYKCGDRTCYRTETYWEWEVWGRDSWHSKQFTFLKRTFPYEKVKFNNDKYVDTVGGGFHVRYVYYAIPRQFEGSLFLKTKDKDISNTKLHADKTIKEIMASKEKEADRSTLIFWIIWGILIVALVIGFMVLENRYLNGK